MEMLSWNIIFRKDETNWLFVFKNLQIKSPWDPLVSRHASFPLETWNWREGDSSSLPAGTGASSASCSLSDTAGDEDDDDEVDDDDDEEEDLALSLCLDCLSSSPLSGFSSSCLPSDPGGRLLLDDLLEDRGRAEVGLDDSATGEPGEDDFADFFSELREPAPFDEDFSEPLIDPLGEERGDEWAEEALGGDIERDLGGETGGKSGSLTRGLSALFSCEDRRLFANCCKTCCCWSWSCCVWLNCCMRSCSCCSFCLRSRSCCWSWRRFCSSWISLCLEKNKMKQLRWITL